MDITESENQIQNQLESNKSITSIPKPMQYLEQILEAVISTPKAEPLTFVQGNTTYETRAQIHGLLIGKFGSGRTTSILKLPNTFYLTEYTLPGIVGTINSQGKYVEGAIRNAAGKTLIVDEVQNVGERAKLALLSMLEEQIFSRALGYDCGKSNETIRRSKYFKARITNGNTISINCIFSCICSGVYAPTKTQVDMAWISRFFPVKVFRTLSDIKKLVRGELQYDIKEHIYKHPVTFDNYIKFTERYFEIIENKTLKFAKRFLTDDSEESGFLSRNVCDTARLACYFAGKAGESTVSDEHYEKALTYAPVALYNYLHTDLGEIDYKILAAYPTELTQTELAALFNVDQATISRRIMGLVGKGLLVTE